jgi:uncharacterized membrane protein YecN with MAPEG domain
MLSAGVLGLLILVLALRVTDVRRRNRVPMGDAGDPLLVARIRAHANCIENAPVGLFLLFLVEQQWGAAWFTWVLGAMLILGRILHPLGMERPAPNAPRLLGTLLGWLMIGAAAILLLIRGLTLLGQVG